MGAMYRTGYPPRCAGLDRIAALRSRTARGAAAAKLAQPAGLGWLSSPDQFTRSVANIVAVSSTNEAMAPARSA